MTKHIGKQLRQGAWWTYLQTGGTTAIQFLGGIVLARILEPSDFGVFAAVTAYTAILTTQLRFGLQAALLQAKTPHPDSFSAAFWVMESLAVVATGVAFLIADYLQTVYKSPDYADVMRLTCISFFIIPYVAVNNAFLQRKMNFKVVSQGNIIAGLLSLPLTIVFALLGWGPYSLVIGGIITTGSMALYVAWKNPWLPSFCSFSPIRGLFRYAWFTNVNRTQDTIIERADNMIVGALLGTASLGIYARAFSLARLPVEVLAMNLRNLVFSGLSRIQDDLEHTRSVYQKVLCAVSLAVSPFLLVLFFIAENFIEFVYGEKWLEAALPMRIMAIGAFATLLSISLRSLSAAQNLVRSEAKIQLASLVITVVFVYFGSRYGLSGVATVIAIREWIVLFLLVAMVSRANIGIGWFSMAYATAPTVAAGLVAALVTSYSPGFIGFSSYLEHAHALTSIFVLSSILFLSYIGSLILFSPLWKGHIPFQSTVEWCCRISDVFLNDSHN